MGRISGAPRRVCGTLAGGGAPVRRRFCVGLRRAAGARVPLVATPCRTDARQGNVLREPVSTKCGGRSIDAGRRASARHSRTAGRARGGGVREALGLAGVRGTISRRMVARARAQRAWSKPHGDLHQAIGPDMREEAAEKREASRGVDGAGTTHLPE